METKLKRQMELIENGVYEALYVVKRESVGTRSLRHALESSRIQELLKTNTFHGELFYKKVPDDYPMEKSLCVNLDNIAIRITNVQLLDDDVTDDVAIRIRFSSDLNSDFIMKHCKVVPRMIGQFGTDLMNLRSYTNIRIVTFDLIADVNKPITVEEAINTLQTFPKGAILVDNRYNYISMRKTDNSEFIIIE